MSRNARTRARIDSVPCPGDSSVARKQNEIDGISNVRGFNDTHAVAKSRGRDRANAAPALMKYASTSLPLIPGTERGAILSTVIGRESALINPAPGCVDG